MEEDFDREKFEKNKKYLRDTLGDLPTVARFLTKAAIHLCIRLTFGYQLLTQPEIRKIIHRQHRVGLLAGSIFQDHLHVPVEGGSLQYQGGTAGRFVGYDFHRKQHFGQYANKLFQGRLWTFLPTAVADNPANFLTPTGFLNIFDLEHLLTIDTPTLAQSLENGLITETTYGEAFATAGMAKTHGNALAVLQLEDQQVYQITLKGNGLVFIDRDGGDKRRQDDRLGELKPAYGIPGILGR